MTQVPQDADQHNDPFDEGESTGRSRGWWIRVGIGIVIVAVIVGGGIGWAVTAHNSSSNKGGGGSTSAASANNANANTEPSIQVSTPPGSVKGYVGARKDVTGLTCTASANSVTAAGKVTNSTDTAQNYRIYISILSGSKTLGLKEVDVSNLAGKASKDWTSTQQVTVKNPQCVLRVERNDAK